MIRVIKTVSYLFSEYSASKIGFTVISNDAVIFKGGSDEDSTAFRMD